ncbi:MAG: heavy-metal-associated domain-containing protein [Rikenellaceae bacterium]|nr:heavy-metal-associated domain-containing protein [Rikenellaceae bacterium]
MGKIIFILAALISVSTANAAPQPDKKQNIETVTYEVNLNCEKCKARLEKHIPFEKGVKDMEVDVAGKKVTVSFDSRKNTADGIAGAIEKLGYTVVVTDRE